MGTTPPHARSAGRTVALMQPTFLPWQGFFGLMSVVDEFVILDDFQFSRQSFQQRNRVFVAREQPAWITVPVDRHAQGVEWPTLAQVKPILQKGFARKLLTTLRQSYASALFSKEWLPRVETWLTAPHENLALFNEAFIRLVAEGLGLPARLRRSSEIAQSGTRSVRVANLLQELGATAYVSARGSYGYMVEDGVFPLAGVDTRFLAFDPVPYPQVHAKSFVPYLSVLDALMQVGSTATLSLLTAGVKELTAWDAMATSAFTATHAPEETEASEHAHP